MGSKIPTQVDFYYLRGYPNLYLVSMFIQVTAKEMEARNYK